MERPLRTGVLFGLGFSVIFVGLSFLQNQVEMKRNAAFAAEMRAAAKDMRLYFEPELVRAVAAVREDRLVVLVTVRNRADKASYFGAEALIAGKDGAYYDTCPAPRMFELEPKQELSFRAECPKYGIDEAQSLATIGNIKVQFYGPDVPRVGR